MDKQITIFEYINSRAVKPCECGNYKLAVRYTGCGTPVGGYKSYPLVYEKFIYSIFCPKCYRVATTMPLGWRSNKTSIKDALKDWNTNPHKLEETHIKGRYGHQHYAEIMKDTIALFPHIIEALGKENIYIGE